MKEKIKEIIIDAKGAVVGRLSSFAAKKALQGNFIIIVNSEEAIIIGRPKQILESYLKKFRLGRGVQKGPLFPRKSEAMLRRAIRGMIGWKKTKGREAFKRVKCYEGMPEKYTNDEKISVFKREALNFITLGRLSELIRQK
ncbi:MAG: 50S ribosomal protein L13 [Candidatus Pacearchaeota archaeon]|nr:MAG: 50S ribosomal protein L13 [Candidatus Pacearchaeota archaeon]